MTRFDRLVLRVARFLILNRPASTETALSLDEDRAVNGLEDLVRAEAQEHDLAVAKEQGAMAQYFLDEDNDPRPHLSVA